MGKKFKILEQMNSGKWKDKVPHLQNDPQNPRKKIIVGAKSMDEARKKDLEQFGARNEIKIALRVFQRAMPKVRAIQDPR